jgi:hypothetical protein
MDLLNPKLYRCDSFREWVQYRGIKIADLKTLNRVTDPLIIRVFFDLTREFFKANPSFYEGILVTNTVVELINKDQVSLIPELILTDRFQWPKQVNDWTAELLRIRDQVSVESISESLSHLKISLSQSKDEIVHSRKQHGLEFKVQPVSDGVHINAFVSSSKGLVTLLEVLENLKNKIQA